MKRWHNNRGSAVIMVVGLVVVIAMLGATFLLVAHMNAKTAGFMSTASAAHPFAEGALEQIKAGLKERMYVHTGAPADPNDPNTTKADYPYANTPGFAAGWKEFITYPADDMDRLLSCTNPYDAGGGNFKWQYLANFCGDTSKITDIAVSSTTLVNTDGLLDSSGNPYRDAYLYNTGVVNDNGQTFWAAISVKDLSSMLCVNTAGFIGGSGSTMLSSATGLAASPTSPVSVDLSGYLNYYGGNYASLHKERCGAQPGVTAQSYSDHTVGRLLSPNPYTPGDGHTDRPFAIGDEMYLRNLTIGAPTEAGRLWNVLKVITNASPNWKSQYARRLLTTYNVSGDYLRRPGKIDPTFPHRMVINNPLDAPGDPNRFQLDNSVHLQRLYKQMLGMLNDMAYGAPPFRKRMAASFVANLGAYTGIIPGGTEYCAFQPTGENFTAYGLLPQLVVAEAYAMNLRDSGLASGGPAADDSGSACAIELYNPTTVAVDTTNYHIRINATDVAFTDPKINVTSVPANGRLVLYTYNGKVGTAGSRHVAMEADFGFDDAALGVSAPAVRKAKLDELDLTKTIDIVWTGASNQVPLDRVTGTDFGFKGDNTTDECQNGRRDDNPSHQRSTVAKMKTFTLTIDDTGGIKQHKLGKVNDLTLDDLKDSAMYATPIVCPGTPMKNLGELDYIYLTGPLKDGATSTPFTLGIVQGASDCFQYNQPARGRFDYRPNTIGGGSGGWAGGRYPDVPAAAIYGEVFSLLAVDPTRMDEPTRIYGRVNINTAPLEVLQRLFPKNGLTLAGADGVTISTAAVDPAKAARYIIAYRDKLTTAQSGLPHDYSNRQAGAVVTNLRAASDFRGFLTPDEVAIPLGDYANELLGWTDYTKNDTDASVAKLTRATDYIGVRDSLYRFISNLITVNSNAFAATIVVQLYDSGKNPQNGDKPAITWRYMTVLDRSNCRKATDSPAVLLFSEIR